jgi:DNA recombination protein RmuC
LVGQLGKHQEGTACAWPSWPTPSPRARKAAQRDAAETLKTLSEHARADRELLQSGLKSASEQLTHSIEAMNRTVGERLEAITGHVNQRLDEGFRKTNETFTSVMARLATIDEAQKKIGDLTTNVVSLQELLGDKRARGAFGEVQLEALVRNALPPEAFDFQYPAQRHPRRLRAAPARAHRHGGGRPSSPRELPPHVRGRGGRPGAPRRPDGLPQ